MHVNLMATIKMCACACIRCVAAVLAQPVCTHRRANPSSRRHAFSSCGNSSTGPRHASTALNVLPGDGCETRVPALGADGCCVDAIFAGGVLCEDSGEAPCIIVGESIAQARRNNGEMWVAVS